MEFVDDNRCFACGQDNPTGLKLRFSWDGDEYYTDFFTEERFQGYSGMLHGGIAATILDEVMARHLTTRGIGVVTAGMEVRYRKPVPTGLLVRFTASEVGRKRNLYLMAARAILPDGLVAVEATARFVRLGDINRESGEDEQ